MSTDFKDLIFQTAKATVDASQVAFDQGYAKGYKEGMEYVLQLIEARNKPVEVQQ